uniref:Uncharacterized protein n=1 Tax=Prymnesium polylepis TaxID=72548 RepID=A0A7S4HPG6_9EUKA|mmetsp:Transcript_9853/g.26210  ORF Transcript_9853/g.26210 Transcript_9853/m.26210 type:complete len:299 (-) Transcript_9853:322-1218(-)
MLEAGDNVLICGDGPVMILAAKLAAIKGYSTTCALAPRSLTEAPKLVYTDAHPEGSLPLSFLPIAGPDADSVVIDECVANSKGLIVAFDREVTMPEGALKVFMPDGETALERVVTMSRYLNGAGMGFFASAAKVAANTEIWAAGGKQVDAYRAMEQMITSRAAQMNVGHTIIRAGTLKGGAVGDSLTGEGGGESSFLNTFFYTLGQQDVVNWRLLYDCDVLGVDLERGDTMPGPGVMAATTATSSKGGAGDSHRGAVATALVEALSAPEAVNSDFSVGAKQGRDFPTADEWKGLFAAA